MLQTEHGAATAAARPVGGRGPIPAPAVRVDSIEIFQEALVRMLIFGLTLLGVIGCASRGRPAFDPNAMTLCVQNEAIGYGNIIVYAGTTRFTVYPSQQVCRDIRVLGPGIAVRAGSTAGTSMGPLRFAFQLPHTADCWHWRVNNSNVIDIVECQ